MDYGSNFLLFIVRVRGLPAQLSYPCMPRWGWAGSEILLRPPSLPPSPKHRTHIENKSSQNGACLAWKSLVDLGRVFCTYLEPPNSHIVQKPKIHRKLAKFTNLLISPYLPFKGIPYCAYHSEPNVGFGSMSGD